MIPESIYEHYSGHTTYWIEQFDIIVFVKLISESPWPTSTSNECQTLDTTYFSFTSPSLSFIVIVKKWNSRWIKSLVLIQVKVSCLIYESCYGHSEVDILVSNAIKVWKRYYVA